MMTMMTISKIKLTKYKKLQEREVSLALQPRQNKLSKLKKLMTIGMT